MSTRPRVGLAPWPCTSGLRLGWIERLNGAWHKRCVMVFVAIVLAHWGEHVFQAVEIYGLGWPIADANGALGLLWPWLVKSEWLHYGYAVVMLIGLIVLRPGFTGSGRTWWTAALGIQVWHHFERLLLLVQALSDNPFFGAAKPTSLIQLLIPRVELHLFYNALVTMPMAVAIHHQLVRRPSARGVRAY